jgi:hypothetical protein
MHPKGSIAAQYIELMEKHDAAMLYLNWPECYCIFNSLFAFPFFFGKKIMIVRDN